MKIQENIVKKALTAIWEFFKRVHAGTEEASAKRVYGGLIIISLLCILYFVSLKLVPKDVWLEIQSTVEYMFTIGASLLGLNTIIDIYKVKRSRAPGSPEDKSKLPPNTPEP